MAATAHLTLVAPDNEKFTVPIGAKPDCAGAKPPYKPKIGRLLKPFHAGKRGSKGVSD